MLPWPWGTAEVADRQTHSRSHSRCIYAIAHLTSSGQLLEGNNLYTVHSVDAMEATDINIISVKNDEEDTKKIKTEPILKLVLTRIDSSMWKTSEADMKEETHDNKDKRPIIYDLVKALPSNGESSEETHDNKDKSPIIYDLVKALPTNGESSEGMSFSTNWHLVRHIQVHSRVPIMCGECGKSFIYSYQLVRHKNAHKHDQRCVLCGKVFETRKNLINHKSKVHTKKNYQCSLCKRLFITMTKFIKHKLGHKKDRGKYSTSRVICDLCGISLTCKHDLIQHLANHSGIKPYTCEICKKAFSSKYILIKHLRVHDVGQPAVRFACDTCGKSFAFKRNLALHIKTHGKERPYTCAVCKLTFCHKVHLRYHFRIRDQVPKYGICKTFPNKRIIKRHKLPTATSHLLHACNICGLSFAGRLHLWQHKRGSHSKSPDACERCGKSFTIRKLFLEHRKDCPQSKKNTFICQNCGTSFSDESHLKYHVKRNSEFKNTVLNTYGKYLIDEKKLPQICIFE